MKLVNQSLLYLSVILFFSAGIWGVLFYYQVLDQFKATIDSGLENYKIVLIDKLKEDSLIIERNAFRDNNYLIRRVDENYALKVRDVYKDTLIRSELKNTSYQTRMLTTAFLNSGNEYFELKIVSQELDREYLIRKIASSLALLLLFLLISTILLNKLVLKKTWSPFYSLLKFLNKFRLDKSEQYNPPETTISEFIMLNESVGTLIKSNIEIYNSQKQFIENASHELQTPLAISINKLELLADGKELSSEKTGEIGEIIRILERHSELNKALLLLSKIENRMFADLEPVNLKEIVTGTVNDFADYARHRKIKIKFYPEEEWYPEMSRNLAGVMVVNLIKNAIVHNKKDGEIIITLSSFSLKIENTGDEGEIPEERLFERFFKKSGKHNSPGLGLAIIKAVADTAGLKVNYRHNGNHIFEIGQFADPGS